MREGLPVIGFVRTSLLAVLLFFLPGTVSHVSGAAGPEGADANFALLKESLRKGSFREAIVSGSEAARLYGEMWEVERRLQAMVMVASAHQSLGRYRQALSLLETGLKEADKYGDRRLRTLLRGELGEAYLLTESFSEAEKYLDEALDMAQAEGFLDLVAATANTRGNLRVILKRPQEAVADYEASLEAAESSGDPLSIFKASINLAKVYLTMGEYEGAAYYLTLAGETEGKLTDSHDKAYGLIQVGNLYRELSRRGPSGGGSPSDRAREAFEDAIDVADRIGDHLALAYGAGYLGGLHEESGEPAAALRLTRRAQMESQLSAAAESSYLWQWQAARILEKEGRGGEALTAYRNAVAALQSIRQELMGDCKSFNRLDYKEVVEPVYLGLVDLLLKRGGGGANVKDRTGTGEGLLEAIQVMEMMKTAELQDYLLNTCVESKSAIVEPSDLRIEKTALVYFMLLPERVEIVVAFPEGLAQYTVPTDREALTHLVRQFRHSLMDPMTDRHLAQGRKLFDRLISPFAEELSARGIETVVFVPDGPLRTIPMAALNDGEGFLVSDYAVVTVPGLTLTDFGREEIAESQVLLMGLSESVQGFPSLDFVPAELKSIREIFGGTVLMNSDFKVPRVREEMEKAPFNIIHIASHGEFSGNALETFLLTWDNRLDMDQLEKFVRMSRYRKKPLDLLTLSACQTAAENDRAALGLAGLSVKAGAKSVLATLWPIFDRASSDLVTEFYRQLKKPELTKARALQLAQIALLSDTRYRHPSFWSPFMLIGNWI